MAYNIQDDLVVSGSIYGTLQGTASYALTASYATTSAPSVSASYAATASYVNPLNQILILTGSLNVSGSTTQVGNNTLIGNTVLSGSVNISGSTTVFGTTVFSNSSTTITGSLLVSGSTIQIGNNTLSGNTLLSGSIIISGSTITPTVRIYGDTTHNGYIRFDPVTTNIDQSLSASYIYVSGSTNDMYFTQNGSGYNNTTRLRWLEGGALYTGLLRGGVISSTPGSTTFNISSGSGLLVTINASTGSEPYPTVQYISWPNFTSQPITYSGSAKITYVGISSTNQIIQQTVPWGSVDINQWDNSLSLGVVLHLSGSVSTGVFNAPQISYGGQQKTDDFFRAFGPLKISGHTLRASGSSPTLSIIKDAGTSYREGANYVINANHPSTVVENSINTSKIYRYYISGSTPIIDTGVANAGYTTIDSKNYVNTATGTLTTVGAGYWSIQRVFWIPNSPTNAFIVYYGNARYGTLVDATNAKDSEPFIEAPNTAQNAIFIGYIIIQGGGSGTPPRDLLNASEATIIPAGLFRNVGGIGSSGTNFVSTTLAGLADVSLSGLSTGDLLVYNAAGGSQWNNAKQLTGTYGLTGSLSATQNITANSFTGSLQGTASFASTASVAPNYVLTSTTSSMLSPYLLTSTTSSFATTGSNRFVGNQTITGSLVISSSADPQFVIGNNLLTISSSGQMGISGSIIPNTHNLYTLGTTGVRFATLFVQGTVNGNTGLFNNINMGSSTPMSIINNNSVTVAQWYGLTANLRLQSGSTPAYVDNGYRLQINSLGAVSGGLYITGSTNQQLMRIDAPGSSSILLVSSSGRVNVNGGFTLNGSDIDTAWTSYTPAWTTDGVTQSVVGNGTLTGAYKQIGKTVFVRVKLNWGTTTTGGTGAFLFSLPVTASNADGIQFPCSMLDNGNAWYQGTVNGTYSGFTNRTAIIAQSPGGANSSQGITSTFPFTWGSTDSLQFNGSYESI